MESHTSKSSQQFAKEIERAASAIAATVAEAKELKGTTYPLYSLPFFFLFFINEIDNCENLLYDGQMLDSNNNILF